MNKTGFASIAKPWIKSLSTYEPGKPIEEVAREMGIKDVDSIVKLASNENALGPSPLALKAMARFAAGMHRYPDGGAHYLRQDLAAKLRVKPDQIIIGNGSNELLDLTARVFLDKGSNIVMADRAFVVYRLLAALSRAQVIAVPMKNHVHDLDAMLKAINKRTRIVFVSNPNNPSGTVVSPAKLDRFVRAVPPGVVIAIDEAYIELLPPREQPDTLGYVRKIGGPTVMLFRSFSKTYGLAGLRVGYVVAPAEAVALLHRVRQPFNVNALALEAARAALADDRHVERTRRLVKEGLALFEKAFRAMGLKFVPSSANFILVETGKGRDTFQALLREGVIVRPMDVYGLPEHVRITVGTPAENRRCIKALKKVLGT